MLLKMWAVLLRYNLKPLIKILGVPTCHLKSVQSLPHNSVFYFINCFFVTGENNV